MLRTAITAALLLPLCQSLPTDYPHNTNTTTLDWTPCTLDFSLADEKLITAHGEPILCANLTVPLDYTNPQNGNNIELNLVRVKANKEPFKGSVLMNPGGPGGSGVQFVATEGPTFRDYLGGQHDVIGFDPRGTGRTMPFACIPPNNTSSTLTRRQYNNFTIPQNDMYSVLKSKAWDDAGIYVESCASTPGNAEIGPFLSTPFVARDMLNIVDALGEDGLLRLWGISYGSVLGQTFAGMFPDRVGRILIDSVVRLDDYYSGQWATVNRDTETALLNFFKECVGAGPDACPIANFTGPDTTPEDLLQELATVFQELLDDPVLMSDSYQPIVQPWWQAGGLTVYQELKYYILVFLYRPDQFALLYIFLDLALKRDWTSLTTLLETPAPSNLTAVDIPWNLGTQSFHAIACSDSGFRADKPEDMYSLVRAQSDEGSFIDVFGPQVWPCAQWKFEAVERYEGPFLAINTSFPLMMVNGNHDPITPLSGAWEASSHFVGSRLLVQNGHGHGVMNHPSACTIKAIAEYFNDGLLPDVGIVCEPDQSAYEVFLELVAAQALNSTIAARDLQDITKRSLL